MRCGWSTPEGTCRGALAPPAPIREDAPGRVGRKVANVRREQVPGLALVIIGATLLVLLQLGATGEVVVALVGAAFLVVYAATRSYGFLVPGGILTGLGIGLVLESILALGGGVLLSLAAGFAFVALLDRIAGGRREGGWWPLIPAGILAVTGLTQVLGGWEILRQWWPLALIAVGVAGFVRAYRRDVDPGSHGTREA